MKIVKMLSVLMVLATVSFSQIDPAMDRVLGANTDSVFVFSFNTRWRVHVDHQSFTGSPYQDPSEMTWIINRTTGEGLMLDETRSITSVYTLNDVTVDFVYTLNNVKALLVYGGMTSDAGNSYTFMINDNQNQIVMAGPALNSTVIREYYNVDVNSARTSRDVRALF
jgi:hypothetical protein